MSLYDISPDDVFQMTDHHPQIPTFLPLTEATYFILLSLAPGPKHGYAIMKEVQQMSQGRVTFSTGTLYGAIKRLLDLGWIIRFGENPDESGRTRKSYELSNLGRSILNAEISRMRNLVQLAASIKSQEI